MKFDNRSREHVDPFADDIVNEPRQIDHAVEPLNSRALESVMGAFKRLQARPLPRLGGVPNVLVLLSPEPGYGKSHLIGRLFRRLGDLATVIYARPYQDPSSCWIGVLERIVTELDYPENAGALALAPGDLTQLDVLARCVMLHLVRRLLDAKPNDVPDPERAADLFRKYPHAVFETPEWREWLTRNFDAVLPQLDALLANAAVHLTPRRTPWLRILFKYAFSENNPALRQICLEWLRYKEIDPEDAAVIGLRGGDLPESDIPYEQRNERSFERIRELFKLAAFYRPFLLCFDQTELYGKSEELARSFGVVLSRLRRETANHLVIVTANEAVWRPQLLPRFEEADRHVLQDPIHLDGVDKAHARELLLARLNYWDVPKDTATAFLDGWLDAMFTDKMVHSPRTVLREASRRWSNPPKLTPKALFESYRQRLLADPKRLDFDPGVFQLISEQILGPAARAEVKPFRSKGGYLSLELSTPKSDVLFGFQGGSHWKTWDSMLREARQCHETRKHHGRDAVARFFRTEDQKPISKKTKAALADAKYVRLINLSRGDTARVYAAHDLYADVEQGNHGLPTAELLAFLQHEFHEFASMVLRGVDTVPPPPPPPVADAVREAVRTLKFATVDLVVERIAQIHKDVTKDAVLEECRKLPSIRVFASPNNIMLRWIPSP